MALTTEQYVEEKFGMPIRDVIRLHQRQFLTIPEIAREWRCSTMTVRRIYKEHQATTRVIGYLDDSEPSVLQEA